MRGPRSPPGAASEPPCAPSQVSDPESAVSVEFTPTIPHCSMATLIGLSIKVKLIRSLPERFKVSGGRASGLRPEGSCSVQDPHGIYEENTVQ